MQCFRVLPSLFFLGALAFTASLPFGAEAWAWENDELYGFLSHSSFSIKPQCDKVGCYQPDPLGGWGVRPLRTYKIVYSADDAVCTRIQKALNDTIKIGKAAEARVIHPQPRFPDEESPEILEKKDVTYRSQNPLFSDPIFLQWKYISTDKGPENWMASQAAANLIHADPNLPGARFFQRWLMVPFKNDGDERLVTTWSPSSIRDTTIGSPDITTLWVVSKKELGEKNWSDYLSYRGFEQEKKTKKLDLDLFVEENKISGLDEEKDELYKTLKANFDRGWFTLYFASLENRIYEIFVNSSPYYLDESDRKKGMGLIDRMFVVEAKDNGSQSICFLDSMLYEKKKK